MKKYTIPIKPPMTAAPRAARIRSDVGPPRKLLAGQFVGQPAEIVEVELLTAGLRRKRTCRNRLHDARAFDSERERKAVCKRFPAVRERGADDLPEEREI